MNLKSGQRTARLLRCDEPRTKLKMFEAVLVTDDGNNPFNRSDERDRIVTSRNLHLRRQILHK